MNVSKLHRIARLNRFINDAIADKNIEHACELMKQLHKLEVKDGKKIGSYRI